MNAVFLSMLASGVGIVGGLVSSTGSIMAVGAFFGIGLATCLAFSPVFLFGAVLVSSLLIGGLAEFYLGIGQANWLPSVFGFVLFGMVFLLKYGEGDLKINSVLPSVSWLISGYVLILFSSSVANGNTLAQILVGVRNYIPFIGVFLAVTCFPNPELNLKRWILMLIWVAIVQFPFCLQQALFIAPMRERSLAAVGGGAEAIVGTFGGNPLGGGYTGEMAVFVLIATIISFAISGSIRFGRSLGCFIGMCAIGSVALAETKIVFILAPIAVFIAFYEEIRTSPKRMLGLLVILILVLGGLATIYAWRFWGTGLDEVWHAFTYSFDPNFMVDKLHRGRAAALVHWWDNNIVNLEPLNALLGYGPASTLEGSRVLGEGSAVKVFGFGLDAHAASKLLWDAGILGFGFLAWIIIRTGWNAHRLVHFNVVPMFHCGVLKGTRAAMFCFAAMLPYQVSVVGGAPMQFLFWFFVGYVEYWRKQVKKDERCIR